MILRLAEAAKRCGWEAEILATDPTFIKVANTCGVPTVALQCIWRPIRPLRDVVGFFRLYRFLRASNYTIVHTHTSKAGFVGRIAARLAGIPIVIHTAHGFALHERSGVVVRTLVARLERVAGRFADRLITVSKFHRDWALRLNISDPTRVIAIPNGIPETRVYSTRTTHQVRMEIGIGPGEAMLLTLGRLAPQKGIEYLLRAVPLVRSMVDRPFRVVLAGDGELRAELQALAEGLGVARLVVFLGFREDVGDLVAASDVVVLPSLREGLSIALLEAMAAGKPIVATSIGSNVEATGGGRGALLVPPRDVSSLANAVATLLNSPELCTKLAKQARKIFEQEYTEERMLESYVRLYQELIAEKVARPQLQGGQV